MKSENQSINQSINPSIHQSINQDIYISVEFHYAYIYIYVILGRIERLYSFNGLIRRRFLGGRGGSWGRVRKFSLKYQIRKAVTHRFSLSLSFNTKREDRRGPNSLFCPFNSIIFPPPIFSVL
jgi:hypothetical protein